MTVRSDCPYGAEKCPKVDDLEKKVARMERNQAKILYTIYFVAGIVSVELGIVII